MSTLNTLKVADIRIDGGTQSRAEFDDAVMVEYADAITAGAKMPPVTVFFDGSDYWLADGFHRLLAHLHIGALDIEATVISGSRRDAILFSVGANASHGMRRTNEDKHRAVGVLLADPEWAAWSDREIARRCSVSHPLVSSIRASLEELPVSQDEIEPVLTERITSEQDAERVYTTKHGTEAVMKTVNIGRSPAASSARAAANEAGVNSRADSHQEYSGPVYTRETILDEPAIDPVEADLLRDEISELKFEVEKRDATIKELSTENDRLFARNNLLEKAVDPDAAARFTEMQNELEAVKATRDLNVDKVLDLTQTVTRLKAGLRG
jgi:hypothetical protein